MADKYVFGIDLGTTYSCIAYVDDAGRAVVAKNADGKNTTPSVVQIEDDGNVVVGQAAKDNAVFEEESTISFVKRQIGKTKIAKTINDIDYSPEEISSYILRKLAQDVAESSLGVEVKDVVITCPAYFGEAERLATQNAGEIAGLNVMEVIKEPLAAAIDYGTAKAGEKKNFMVFDLGGGTFDVTVMKISEDAIEEVCSRGDHNLGGKDWDDATVRYLKDQFIEQTGLEIEFTAGENQEVRAEAEKAKWRLSGANEAKVRITAGGQTVQLKLTREIFDEITESLLEQTFDITDDAIEAAKEKGVSIDEILLVGGSTRMPQIKEAVVEKYSIEPKLHDPDEAVAKGAAIHAVNVYVERQANPNVWDSAAGDGSGSEEAIETEEYKEELAAGVALIGSGATPLKLTTVATKSYGIAVVDSSDPQGEKEVIANVLFKDTPLVDGSVSGTLNAGTHKENQTTVSLKVFESDFADETYDLYEDFLVGSAALSLPSGLPAGAPVEVALTLNSEGLLHVYGKDLTGNNEVHADLQVRISQSKEELEEIKQRTKTTLIKDM